MRRGLFEGWILVLWAAALGLALAAIAIVHAGAGEAGLRLWIRLSARESCALFLAVFAARPLNAVAPGSATRWLLRNRRALGVSLAASHALHLAAIGALAAATPASFQAGVSRTTVIGGGLGYVLLALMTATSFDRTAAAIGRRAWKALHTAGIWVLFVIFASSYGPRAAKAPVYALAAVPLVAVAVLRAAVFLRKKSA